MIQSFRHKGLEAFFTKGDRRKLPADMVLRVSVILHALSEAEAAEELSHASFRLHLLKGQFKGFWAVTVRANWRIVFRFENGHAFDVDFLDYH